jgi:hypothetical protein
MEKSQFGEWVPAGVSRDMEQVKYMAMETLREIKAKHGLGDRHVMREKNRELTEAWHLLNVLCLNMMDDGPTWPRVLEWLRRNEQFRPENASAMAPATLDADFKKDAVAGCPSASCYRSSELPMNSNPTNE